MRPSRPLVLFGVVSLTLGGCASDSDHPHDHAGAPAHWGYSGEAGPSHWAHLSPDNALCDAGHCQSPINLSGAMREDLPNPVFGYRSSAINIINNGHTVQVNVDPGSSMALDGKNYPLVQFHFHAPSEHHVNGKSHAAEMHLVHKATDGQLAVVGVFIKAGRENPAFTSVWSQLPAEKGDAHTVAGGVNPADLLPSSHASYRYSGSLTTPPCSEGVVWTVMTTPIEMSESQIRAFTKLYSGNNRPIQSLDGRVLVEDSTP